MAPEIESWAARMRAEGIAERTISERVRIVHQAAAATGASATTLAEAGLVEWLGGLPSAGTRGKYFGCLRAWSSFLVRTGARTTDPTAELRSPRVPRRRPRPVADEHLELLLASGIRRRARVMIHLMAYEGLRRHEVARFRGEDVDLIGHLLHVIGKGGVEEWLPLHPIVAADAKTMPRHGYWFESHTRPGEPLRAGSVGSIVSRALHRVGVDASGHNLRHWYGTALLRTGTDVRVVQTLMRHASLATTAIYTHVDEDRREAAVARLPVLPERRRAA